METVDNRTFKEKIHEKAEKLKWTIEDGVKWVKENPKETAAIAIASVAGLKTIFKIGKTIYTAVDDKQRRKEIYCNDIQSTVKLKHELSYNEARELRDRMDAGQTKFEALDCMSLLKK